MLVNLICHLKICVVSFSTNQNMFFFFILWSNFQFLSGFWDMFYYLVIHIFSASFCVIPFCFFSNLNSSPDAVTHVSSIHLTTWPPDCLSMQSTQQGLNATDFGCELESYFSGCVTHLPHFMWFCGEYQFLRLMAGFGFLTG